MEISVMVRQPIKTSVRFEVFKRDSFTCQYCGRKAPDVVLQVDHITPVATGGENDILNLATSCRECNSGKSDKKLSDSAAIEKRRGQLEDLEERRQQLQMLHDWHISLLDLDDQAVDLAESVWRESVGEHDYRWPAAARDEIRKVLKKHGFDDTCNAIREAAAAVMRSPRVATEKDSVANEWFWKIGSVASVRKLRSEDPGAARLLYIRGICRNRFHYCNERECLSLLQRAYDLDVGIEWMETTAKRCRVWSEWRSLMDDAIKTQLSCQQEGSNGTDSQP
jgi:hypothetical protein